MVEDSVAQRDNWANEKRSDFRYVVLQGQSSRIRSRLLVPEDNVKVEC